MRPIKGRIDGRWQGRSKRKTHQRQPLACRAAWGGVSIGKYTNGSLARLESRSRILASSLAITRKSPARRVDEKVREKSPGGAKGREKQRQGQQASSLPRRRVARETLRLRCPARRRPPPKRDPLVLFSRCCHHHTCLFQPGPGYFWFSGSAGAAPANYRCRIPYMGRSGRLILILVDDALVLSNSWIIPPA